MAERASQRSDRLVIALLLGALASSLAAVATARSHTPATLLYAPVALLLGGLTLAVSALLS